MRHLLGFVLLFMIATQTCAASPLCAELRQVAGHSAALGEILEPIEMSTGEWNLRVPNVDLDGDDKNDQILMFKSDSPSLRPGDSARVSVTLSTSAKTFNLVSPYIALIRRKSKYFIVGTEYSEGGFSKRLDVSQVDRRGIFKLCTMTIPSR